MFAMLIQGPPRWLPTHELISISSVTANDPKPSAIPKLCWRRLTADKIRKEEQEQHHPNLNHSYAAL